MRATPSTIGIMDEWLRSVPGELDQERQVRRITGFFASDPGVGS